MKEQTLINGLSITLTFVTFISILMYRYFIDENSRLSKLYLKLSDLWGNSFKEIILRGNKIMLLLKQNQRYSKICRRLYNENEDLKLDIAFYEDNHIKKNNKIKELESKIEELESKKLKPRVKK